MIVKCPRCGNDLPPLYPSEIRKGTGLWRDDLIGEPALAWVSKGPNKNCGFLFYRESTHLTKYPPMQQP